MADTLVAYKCPNCSAPLEFQPGTQKIKCEHCDTELEAAAIEELYRAKELMAAQAADNEDINWNKANAEKWSPEEVASMKTFVCESCGAEIIADERIKESTIEQMQESVQGYESVECTDSAMHKIQGSVSYAMAPVWIVTSRYKNKIYTFMMNGQTGKVAGDLPVSWIKTFLFFSFTFGVFWGLLYYIIKISWPYVGEYVLMCIPIILSIVL